MAPSHNIKPGDTIGVIAATAPAEPERFKHGVQYLEQRGFKVKSVLNPTAGYGKKMFLFGSDTPVRRASGLQKLFADKEVKAIIATRGAYGSAELLPFLDFDLLKRNKKPLIGFSDITALLVPLSLKAGCPVVHGPVIEFAFARAFGGDEQSIAAIDTLLKYLSGENRDPLSSAKLTHLNSNRECKGQVIGGNLSILISLLGTKWQPKLKGKILFIEEIDEAPYRVHRAFLQLSQAGFFKDVSGVLLGEFTNCIHPKGLGPTIDDVFRDIFGRFKVPVAKGLPCGHGKANLPLPFAEAVVSGPSITFT